MSNCTAVPASNSMPLLMYYQNVRGLRTKITDILLNTTDSPYDCIIFTETWLDDCITSAQLFGTNYTVYRSDRSLENSVKSSGGGVFIAVKHTLPSLLLTAAMDESLEQVWVTIRTGSANIVVGAIYIPSNIPNDVEIIERHLSSVERAVASTSPNDDLLIFGDYNRPGLSWKPHSSLSHLFVDALHSTINAGSSCLLEGMAFHDLLQLNSICKQGGRILDLIFAPQQTATDCLVESAPEPLSRLDAHHPPVLVSLNRTVSRTFSDNSDTNRYDFRRADYEAIKDRLSMVNWSELYTCREVDDAVEKFSAVLLNAISDFVPRIRPRRKPAWSNAELRQLKRRLSSARRVYHMNRTGANRWLFTTASRRYTRHNRLLYRRYVQNVERNLRNNPKQFWKYVNSKRKEDGLPTSVFLGDQEACDDPGKCELFARHFSSVFSDGAAPVESHDEALRFVPENQVDVDTFTISQEDVERAALKLKLSFCPGPDGIPAALLKKCCVTVKSPLAFLFNLSLSTSKFPVNWKGSHMFPVFKKGDKRNVEQYRGITSLCACSKLFEIIINEYLFFRCKSYISTAQHGFFPGRSAATNLLEFSSKCLCTIEQRLQIDAVYTDLKAAFDRVDHGILLAKLSRIGFSTRLVNWLRSYLSNRKLAVKLGASNSEWFRNGSGVPQGSTLGPLLFSLFINDVAFLLPPGTRLFYADDVKIYFVIESVQDCERLQHLLNIFSDWCKRNSMTLSISKCTVISFHRKKTPFLFQYTIDGQLVERTDCVKDLGVNIDSSLSFRQHYNIIVSKANRQLGMILKICQDFKDVSTLIVLYCSLVRSVLETNCVVWDPYHDVWSIKMERIQKRFVRHAAGRLQWRDPENMLQYTYDELRMLLGLDSLVERRKKMKATFAHKILTAVYDTPVLLARLQLHCPRRPQRQQRFLQLEPHRTDYGLNEPVRSIALEYNRRSDVFDF